MKKNRIFLLIVIFFIVAMVLFSWHMFSVTSKPWDKKKNDVPGKFQLNSDQQAVSKFPTTDN